MDVSIMHKRKVIVLLSVLWGLSSVGRVLAQSSIVHESTLNYAEAANTLQWYNLWLPAIIGGGASFIVSYVTSYMRVKSADRQIEANLSISADKMKSEIELEMYKSNSAKELRMSERAWADYELRRDIYMKLAAQIPCIFERNDHGISRELSDTVRSVRLIGSDEVVKNMNLLMRAVKAGEIGASIHDLYRDLLNEIRRDIRTFHSLPPQGTELDADAFPIGE